MTEKSRVRFTRSPETGELVGFVSKKQGSGKLWGVPENSPCKKKICVLSEGLKGSITENVLYDVTLRPMRTRNGYVVTTAEQAFFEAKIETTIETGVTYRVTVELGFKTIYFDPLNGRSDSSRTKDGVLKVLNERHDVANLDYVIADFIDHADELLRAMQKDGYDLEQLASK